MQKQAQAKVYATYKCGNSIKCSVDFSLRLFLQALEGVAKIALLAKFDDFDAGLISRKSTYPVGHRRFARNSNPASKGKIWLQMDFCNSLFSLQEFNDQLEFV